MRAADWTRDSRVTACALVLACLIGAGCSSDDAAAQLSDDSCTGSACGPRRDVGSSDDGDGAGSDGNTADTDTGDGTCTPGTPVCVDLQTAGVCLADGISVTEIPCTDGQQCVDGSCQERGESVCVPGAQGGCAGSGALLVCDADGSRFVEQDCPAATPTCRDGVCTDTICDPGARTCIGNDVVLCDSSGQSQDVVETCPVACRAGACSELDACSFDGKYYLGCDFWAVYLDNEARGLSFGVTISNPAGNPVDYEVVGPGDVSISSGVVPAAGLVSVDLSAATQLNGSGISDAAYRVTANGPVTVHQFNPPNNLVEGFSNDASLLLPSNALGSEYRVMAYHSGDDLAVFARLSARWYVTVVATSPGTTTVTVESPAAISAGSGVAAIAPGQTATLDLQQGQVLTLMAAENNGDDPDPGDPADLTGMSITATAPIAVFSGSEASYIPDDTGAADHIEQQLYPVDTWGREYVVAKFAARGTEDDVYRIMTNTPGTVLTTIPAIDQVNGRTLNNAGDAVEFIYRGDFVVQATAPISVGQFMVGSLYPGFQGNCTSTRTSGCSIPLAPECDNAKRIGDPAFLLPVATSQLREDYTFLTPDGYATNWVSIVMPEGASVQLDGAPLSATLDNVGSTTWRVARVQVEPGTHTLVSNVPVGLSVYGYGCDVSYAYPGGLNLETD